MEIMEESMYRAAVKENYGFTEWAGKTQAYEGELVKKYLPFEERIEGFVFEKRRAIPNRKHSFTDYYRSSSNKEVCIGITINEHDTVLAAHEALIDILSVCMSPKLPLLEERGISSGDIGFAGHEEEQTAVFFSRYNVVIEIHNVGTTFVPVKMIAEEIDQQIITHQER